MIEPPSVGVKCLELILIDYLLCLDDLTHRVHVFRCDQLVRQLRQAELRFGLLLLPEEVTGDVHLLKLILRQVFQLELGVLVALIVFIIWVLVCIFVKV